jgi:uncharacterized membrane protein YraQ (UPF0718 family)
LLLLGAVRGQGEHVQGLQSGARMVITTLPLLLFVFVVSGMVQILVPSGFVSRWVGPASGMRGILIGAVAGGFTPGGPYVSLPLATVVVNSGAGIGTVVSFLTAWSLWAVARLPMEVGILGWRITLIRLVVTFPLPLLAGAVAHALFGEREMAT